MEWLGKIGELFVELFNWLIDIWNLLIDTFYRIILSFYDMGQDGVCWVFESTLDIVISALGGLDGLFNTLNIVQYLNMIPADVRTFLNAIYFGQAVNMIVTALTIRIMLQLIPFTRLGS